MTRILFYDPGAERCGWAVIEGDGSTEPKYIASGILACPRDKKEGYQDYKLRLEQVHTLLAPTMFAEYEPDIIGNEIVPAVGGGSFIVATQSELAKSAISVIHAMAFERQYPVKQIGATSIKKMIGGSGSATKVKVRNGVLALFPELAPRKSEWVKVFDEPDAIAGGAATLGYKLG